MDRYKNKKDALHHLKELSYSLAEKILKQTNKQN